MRMRISPAVAAGLAMLVAAFFTSPAQAMALPAAAGLKGADDAISLTDQVGCRSVWRCGYYGCGWRRVCWAPRPYYRSYHRHYRPYSRPYVRYYRPRRYYRPYVRYYDYPRPYYRPYRYYAPAYAPPPWVSGPYYRPRYFHVGPWVYGY